MDHWFAKEEVDMSLKVLYHGVSQEIVLFLEHMGSTRESTNFLIGSQTTWKTSIKTHVNIFSQIFINKRLKRLI